MRSLFRGGEGGIRPAALGQCRRQPGELGNDTLYRFRPSRGRSLRVPFPNHHFNKNIPPFGRIFLLERVMGLEPTISAWKANVLPLHYTRILCRNSERLERETGLEPATSALARRRSTK